MRGPAVSVIIPVYNTEEYLAEALDSIYGQTLKDIELIAVDDGSTDGSSRILSEYAAKYGTKVISKKNGGQASARNDALDIASGRYVYFMDSDDWIDPGTLERCVTECDEGNLDFVFFDGVSFRDDGDPCISNEKWLDYHRGGDYPIVQKGASVMRDMLDRGTYKCTTCMSLFSRDFLEKNSLRFRSGMKCYEDELFSVKAYHCASRVKGIPCEFYHRRVRPNSTMTAGFSKKNVDGYLTVTEEIWKYFESRDDCGIKKDLIGALMLSVMHNGWNLPFGQKVRVSGTILARYPWSFKLKPFTVFWVKKFLRK